MIRLRTLSSFTELNIFFHRISRLVRYGEKRIDIFLSNYIKTIYPNICVPMAGLLDYCCSHGISVSFEYEEGINEYVKVISFENPLPVVADIQRAETRPLNTIWKFSSPEDINILVHSFVRELSQTVMYEKGVKEGLIWCLNETMDNVLQHSLVDCGYVMGQIHKQTKHIAFCIFDYGQGIHSSLKHSIYHPRYPLDSITLALKEGTTRDPEIGQGNGLWGLHKIVENNTGLFSIRSGSVKFSMTNGEQQIYKRLPFLSNPNYCTTVDFQIDHSKEIMIQNIFGAGSPIDIDLENMLDDNDNIIYKLIEKSSGTGTRKSGERIRIEIYNFIKNTGHQVTIDFSEVSVVSSSFADELIGKLVVQFGFTQFIKLITLANMNDTVRTLVDRSVSQRLSASA